MVDKNRRKKLAFHLRQLSVGLISNDDFEYNVTDDITNGWLPEQYYRAKEIKSDDAVILPILELCWGLYDDTRCHRLTGKDSLTTEGLKTIAICILFLQSDKEYEWPYIHMNNPFFKFSFKDFILTILTFGQHYRIKKSEQLQSYQAYKELGNFDYWPFFRESDYNTQLKNPPFLSRNNFVN